MIIGILVAQGNERSKEDGHLTVVFILNGTGGSNSLNGAAGTQQHRNEGLTGKTKAAEQTVHDKCNTSHVAALFEDCKEYEQDHQVGDKCNNNTQTEDDTVGDKGNDPGSNAQVSELSGNPNHNIDNTGEADADQLLTEAGGVKADKVDSVDDYEEYGECEPLVGENLINLIGYGELLFAAL